MRSYQGGNKRDLEDVQLQHWESKLSTGCLVLFHLWGHEVGHKVTKC